MDIGTTPIGMKVVDWVGGIAYSGSWDHIGWTLEAHRRPVSSSLLSMGGSVIPIPVRYGAASGATASR